MISGITVVWDPPELVHYSVNMMENEVVKKHQKAPKSTKKHNRVVNLVGSL